MSLTMREVQHQSGLSYPAIRRRIEDGTIRAEKQGNKFLINEEDIHLLPKPRKTSQREQSSIETVEVPQGVPFLPMTGAELVQMKKWETIQMMLQTA